MCELPYPCEYIENIYINENSEDYKSYCASKDARPKDKNKVIKKFYDKHLFRKSLICQIPNKSNKSIVVILMNPSYADEDNLDSTLDNVRKYLSSKGYSKFEVLNIFPIRMPNSKNVDKLMMKYDKKGKYIKQNNDYIKEVLKNSKNNEIMLAWGKKYHKYAQWILELLEPFQDEKFLYVYHLNADYSPSHFAPQVYNKYKNIPMAPIKIVKNEKGKYVIE